MSNSVLSCGRVNKTDNESVEYGKIEEEPVGQ